MYPTNNNNSNSNNNSNNMIPGQIQNQNNHQQQDTIQNLFNNLNSGNINIQAMFPYGMPYLAANQQQALMKASRQKRDRKRPSPYALQPNPFPPPPPQQQSQQPNMMPNDQSNTPSNNQSNSQQNNYQNNHQKNQQNSLYNGRYENQRDGYQSNQFNSQYDNHFDSYQSNQQQSQNLQANNHSVNSQQQLNTIPRRQISSHINQQLKPSINKQNISQNKQPQVIHHSISQEMQNSQQQMNALTRELSLKLLKIGDDKIDLFCKLFEMSYPQPPETIVSYFQTFTLPELSKSASLQFIKRIFDLFISENTDKTLHLRNPLVPRLFTRLVNFNFLPQYRLLQLHQSPFEFSPVPNLPPGTVCIGQFISDPWCSRPTGKVRINDQECQAVNFGESFNYYLLGPVEHLYKIKIQVTSQSVECGLVWFVIQYCVPKQDVSRALYKIKFPNQEPDSSIFALTPHCQNCNPSPLDLIIEKAQKTGIVFCPSCNSKSLLDELVISTLKSQNRIIGHNLSNESKNLSQQLIKSQSRDKFKKETRRQSVSDQSQAQAQAQALPISQSSLQNQQPQKAPVVQTIKKGRQRKITAATPPTSSSTSRSNSGKVPPDVKKKVNTSSIPNSQSSQLTASTTPQQVVGQISPHQIQNQNQLHLQPHINHQQIPPNIPLIQIHVPPQAQTPQHVLTCSIKSNPSNISHGSTPQQNHQNHVGNTNGQQSTAQNDSQKGVEDKKEESPEMKRGKVHMTDFLCMCLKCARNETKWTDAVYKPNYEVAADGSYQEKVFEDDEDYLDGVGTYM
ncbi:hypothetical protein TRFO_32986 [Tritrichomonas foetus]|uniref:Uncharacterized protein n=1 Tax=Tritrichomonas foetus TaxID=1144522 RepID=A0A1J4JSZ2_9EUKA|nr:hypothetical protein TRFO_32986 [Tritrichomonas foetus]|eukprot:OHT00389.1 hypothetical protein TRFO_32986 [Tritrichomonas foetus]